MSANWMGLAAALLVAACGAAPPPPVSPPVTASGAEQAIPHGVAKTFAANVGDVRTAVLKSLLRMDVRVLSDAKTNSGWRILAVADERTILIQLEVVSPTMTRMRVIVDRGGWGEKATEAVWRAPDAPLAPAQVPAV